jgi:hypothetical protein
LAFPLDAHLLDDVEEEARHSSGRNVEPLAHHVGSMTACPSLSNSRIG